MAKAGRGETARLVLGQRGSRINRAVCWSQNLNQAKITFAKLRWLWFLVVKLKFEQIRFVKVNNDSLLDE